MSQLTQLVLGLRALGLEAVVVTCQGPQHWLCIGMNRDNKLDPTWRNWDTHPTPEKAVEDLNARLWKNVKEYAHNLGRHSAVHASVKWPVGEEGREMYGILARWEINTAYVLDMNGREHTITFTDQF